MNIKRIDFMIQDIERQEKHIKNFDEYYKEHTKRLPSEIAVYRNREVKKN